jgi:hypothetical protein
MVTEKKLQRRQNKRSQEGFMSEEYRREADVLEARGKHLPAQVFREIAAELDAIWRDTETPSAPKDSNPPVGDTSNPENAPDPSPERP